jgi:hypothetical protein
MIDFHLMEPMIQLRINHLPHKPERHKVKVKDSVPILHNLTILIIRPATTYH